MKFFLKAVIDIHPTHALGSLHFCHFTGMATNNYKHNKQIKKQERGRFFLMTLFVVSYARSV